MRTAGILVGADGTDHGTAAVRWAACEAARRDLPLRVVHVLEWDWAVSRYDFGGLAFEAARCSARAVAEQALRTALQAAPGVDVRAHLPLGRPVAQLLNLSAGATELVIGDRERGGLAGLLPGSVSRRVVAHAHCPVVVVRGRDDPPAGPVATGVDDSASADGTLCAAFATAAARDATLVVVRSYLPPMAAHLGDVPVLGDEMPDQDTLERRRLAEQLAPWQARYPQVPVEMLLSREGAAATLTEISHGTQLVVIGARGHGLLGRAWFGSTTSQLLHHADCPVLVVH
ncbi:universal stress protein [Actinoplanes sp. L3-i22]|uniref:universal stress protein n=1 Tax=Actinoplanes sp. L3-i22 TaxID=2836373 RepID=UPI001C7704B0|nr:universal stress protein [Actinoplanes sp. L3-i22]BCY09389.1 universal stress protein [Actinoplanes sp. L3-i22]